MKIHCPKCETANTEDADVCSMCGHWFKTRSRLASNLKKPRPAGVIMLVIVVAGIVAWPYLDVTGSRKMAEERTARRKLIDADGQQRIADACQPGGGRIRRQIRATAEYYATIKEFASANWSDMLRSELMRNALDQKCREAIAKAVELDGYDPR